VAKLSGAATEQGADLLEPRFFDENRGARAFTHDSPRGIYLIALRVCNQMLEVDSHGNLVAGIMARPNVT